MQSFHFKQRHFSLLHSDVFSQKQVYIVVNALSEIPKEFNFPGLDSALNRDGLDPSGFILLEGVLSGHDRVWILRLDPKKPIAPQVADPVRTWNGGIDLFIGATVNMEEAIEWFSSGVYRFSSLKSEKKTNDEGKFQVVWNTNNIDDWLFRKIDALYLARDLVNLPSNLKNPIQLAKIVESLKWTRTRIRRIDKQELEENSFGMMLAVSSGSDIPPVVMVFERFPEKARPLVGIVGKGVTFDAGGLQIKPDTGMFDMKMDMAWAAATIATFWHLDWIDSGTISAVWAIWLVENLLGWSACKPLDIVQAHNGLMVEIHHTDAEGRLVLWDILSYLSQEYSPEEIVSIATLTGSCIHALWFKYAGLMSRNDELVWVIQKASEKTNECVWRLPLDAEMLKATHARIADRKNISSDMKAGASMGAAFLSQFVPEEIKFAHLDIAGPAYRDKADWFFPEGWTWFGTEILIQYVFDKKQA